MTRSTDDLRRHGELAAAVLLRADAVLGEAASVAGPHAARLWQAARTRAAAWDWELTGLLQAGDREALDADRQRRAVAIVTEVLLAELLTRLWCSCLAAHERRHQSRVGVLADRVMQDQSACRGLALRLMTHPTALPPDRVDELDAVRRRVERWTDCLLAALPVDAWRSTVGGVDIAFDRARCQDFAEDSDHWRRLTPSQRPFTLSELSLRVGLPGPADSVERNRPFLDAIAEVLTNAGPTRPRHPRLNFRRMFPRT